MVHTPWSQRCGLHAGTPRNIKRDVSMQKLRLSNSGRCNLQSWVKHLFDVQRIWSLKNFIKDPWSTFSDTQVIIVTATSFAGLTASPMCYFGRRKSFFHFIFHPSRIFQDLTSSSGPHPAKFLQRSSCQKLFPRCPSNIHNMIYILAEPGQNLSIKIRKTELTINNSAFLDQTWKMLPSDHPWNLPGFNNPWHIKGVVQFEDLPISTHKASDKGAIPPAVNIRKRYIVCTSYMVLCRICMLHIQYHTMYIQYIYMICIHTKSPSLKLSHKNVGKHKPS